MRMIHILTIIDISYLYFGEYPFRLLYPYKKNHIYKIMQYMLFSTLLFKTNQR